MCGICGIFGISDAKTVKDMLSRLVHRGPDDEYFVEGDDFCIGARRLSIIDVQGGRQPLSNESDDIWVAQNGEIYNFPELRENLLSKEHSFKTRCDTEVLVHLYEEYGENFLEYINGMYSIALWDNTEKLGILIRDRVGKKPLYYFFQNGVLYFASEIKALLQVPDFQKSVNFEALHYYLSYKHVPCPLSIFEGIYELPPAHALFFRLGNGFEIRRYWKVSYSSDGIYGDLQEEELTQELIDVLRRAVKRRLISDVPIGFFLSGGIDSSLSTALAAEVAEEQIKTFSLIYPEERETEGKRLDRKYAREISEVYGTEHHEEIIDFSNFPEEFPNIIYHFDQPFSGVVSTYFLSRLISKHVKVALSGDGADELFGSYLSHRLAFPIHDYIRTKNSQILVSPDFWPFRDNQGFLNTLKDKEDWKWRYKLLVFTDEEKGQLYSPEVSELMSSYKTMEHLRGYFNGLTAQDALNRILEAEFYSFFPDQVLAFVDRLSMAHSLEVRTAYLDPEFITLVASIPGRLKIKEGKTKYILKKAALKYLPEEVVFRKKEGFIMPINNWLLYNLENYVRETLNAESLKKHGFFNIQYVQNLIDGFYKDEGNYANRILSLIAFQVWYNMYM